MGKEKQKYICVTCGCTFLATKTAMYCSEACRNKSARMKKKYYCKNCGEQLPNGYKKVCVKCRTASYTDKEFKAMPKNIQKIYKQMRECQKLGYGVDYGRYMRSKEDAE